LQFEARVFLKAVIQRPKVKKKVTRLRARVSAIKQGKKKKAPNVGLEPTTSKLIQTRSLALFQLS
jgi:hypothetical protein